MAEKMITKFKKLLGLEKKKPFVRFYSLTLGVLELFPIIKSKDVPRKFLDRGEYPGHVLPTSTCPGLRKIVACGFIIPAPADFEISTNGDQSTFAWRAPVEFTKGVPDSKGYINSHAKEQTAPLLSNFHDTLTTVVKIETPWRFETSDDMVMLVLPVQYNNEDRFTAATGILDPRYSNTVNIQLFWKKTNGKTLVRAGTPLCQFIPIRRDDLNLNAYDIQVENATELDNQREAAYNYSANCVILNEDNLGARLARATKIFSKFKRGNT